MTLGLTKKILSLSHM